MVSSRTLTKWNANYFLLFFYSGFFLISKHQIYGTENKCTSVETCRECIAEDSRCAWCTQEDYDEINIPRCNYIENLKGMCDNIINPKNDFRKLLDMKLSDKGAKEEEAIQIKPQEVKLRIRPNSPVTFTVEFRQAVDYPVDLYYLMDLSNTMADDKVSLSKLGNKLASEMNTITTNFRLGFGSFVDKVAAPFTNTHPNSLRQPCTGCAAPYGFQNNMPLSLKTEEFAVKVEKSRTSGNLDGPEGGFDAIMQAIVCKDEIGWRNKSRKLLVFSTDSGFHFAGDGKMGGIITPNDERCHLDTRGYYTLGNQLDYPSLSQINRQIKDKKVNLIFAVTKDQVKLYKQLSQRLLGSSTGKLDDDSSNVVTLIRQQYDKITSAVELTDNSRSGDIQVSYQSRCLGKQKKKTNICKGLKVGTNVTFEVTVEVVFCPEDRKSWNRTFDIYPIGLNEYLTVHLEIICECDCEKPWNEEKSSSKCNAGNGTYECGVCNCYGDMYGKQCECDAKESDPFKEDIDCYRENDEKQCSGSGVCRCGKCYCQKRSTPDEKIYGKFCECDNFSCDKKNGKVCNGPDHGICDCGKCKCHKGWKGDDCGCSQTIENCIDHNGKICSERGKCICGSCVCDSSQEYFGKYCDDCFSCPGKCKELRFCVECFMAEQNGKTQHSNCSSCNFPIAAVNASETAAEHHKEKKCTFVDNQNCRFSFKYGLDKNDRPIVSAYKEIDCAPPVDVLAIVAGVSGGVVGVGLLLLLLWKILLTIHDRRELAKFENERLKAKWDAGENPIYKPSTSTFHNPVYKGD